MCDAADHRLSRNFTVNATVNNVALENLNRDTDYMIGVAARTTVGTGVVSSMTPILAKCKLGILYSNLRTESIIYKLSLIGTTV